MATLASFFVCFLILPLSVVCVNQTFHHTMLYVRILNYTNTLNQATGSIPSYDSCCYTMPLETCTHFCKTVFSVCIESDCDAYLFNITYNYDTGRIYDENYGVQRLNVQSIKDKKIIIVVSEIRMNKRTGSRRVVKIDNFATLFILAPSGSFWLSRPTDVKLQNSASSIDLQITAFCEPKWYNPQQNCSEYVQTNDFEGVHYNFINQTFNTQLECMSEETSRITFITKRPYKFTKQILEAQLSKFIADRVCSSIAKDVTIHIESVRYESTLLRVVFSSHCSLGHTSLLSIANKYIQVSDLKLMQALMFMSPYEERQYFMDPVQREDYSNVHNLGHFQLLLRLKRYVNPNNVYYHNENTGFNMQKCPPDGCTPSFHFTYKGITHTRFMNSPTKGLIDCFGSLIDKSNPLEATNNTLMWYSSTRWDENNTIILKVFHNNIISDPISFIDIELDNIAVVSSSYLLARPILISKTNNRTNVSVDVEVMVWCSTGFYGKTCNETCPSENTKCNIGECIVQHTNNQDALLSQIDYHCRKGTCIDGQCKCPEGFAGDRCNVLSNYTFPYNKEYHFEDDASRNTTCEIGYKSFNCDEKDFCYNNRCKHGRCSNDVNIYTCVCDIGFEGFNCDREISICNSNPCRNNATCLEEQTSYKCACQEGYTGYNCETDMDYCINSPCQNNATCLEEQTNYKCACQEGYTGLYCETEIDNCINSPCQNNGTCFEEQTTYKCICLQGYTGLNCETEIDYCINSSCQNNATCIKGQTSYKCSCPSRYTGRNCETYIGLCSEISCKNNATCEDVDEFYICHCPFGFEGTQCEYISNSSLQTRDAIDAGCSSSGWNITVNLTILKHLDPTVITRNIHFGDNECGGKEEGNMLFFQQGFQECLTSKQISGNMLMYINDLFYVIYDPINPFIIRRHEWTFTVQCDVNRNQAASSHIHHDVNAQHIEVSGQYRIDMAFYSDVNFMHELPGKHLHVNLGEDIYVKVYTKATDWSTKMRLHTCYTKPNDAAGKNMTYFIIKDGCEVDINTHIISQSTHETKFVYQDFEYSTNREGLDIHCNATFCDTKDYSPGCAQSCLLL